MALDIKEPGEIAIEKDLYESAFWKIIQKEMFTVFDIYRDDGTTIWVSCSGPYIPSGIFWFQVYPLAQLPFNEIIALEVWQPRRWSFTHFLVLQL